MQGTYNHAAIKQIDAKNRVVESMRSPSSLNSSVSKEMSRDVELLRKVAEEDARALSELYDEYSEMIFALATRILREPTAAEGVVQQVFLLVWQKAHMYEPQKGRVSTWLCTITRNLSIDVWRKGKRSTELITDGDVEKIVDDSENTNPLSQYIENERRRLVIQALESIPKAQRMAVDLAYYGGLSHRQIAETLGEPLGTIKTRIQLGLYKLRQALEPYLSI